jgi:hypothetical protein
LATWGSSYLGLRYLRSLGKHDQYDGHEGEGTHYLTNDEARMPDNIYPGAETRLITDRDNGSITGICTSAAPPTHIGPRLPGKKPHASGKNPWIGTKAANIFTNIQGQGSCISHAPLTTMGQGKAEQDRASIPPIRELQVRVQGKPARPRRPQRGLISDANSAPPGNDLRNLLEYHPPRHQGASKIGPNTVEASNQLSCIWTYYSCKSLHGYICNR